LVVEKRDLYRVGKPLPINPFVVIQYFCCQMDLAAPWQWIENVEPSKHESWTWMDMDEFSNLSELGVYPDINVSGHLGAILEMTRGVMSLMDTYAREDSWLADIHMKDLRRRRGL
jgi:hypothetical protein